MSGQVRPPLCVVGMHRSGTSAVAGVLAGLGVAPARWCAESRSNDANPRGFFEPRPLVWENERLLNWLDSSWACPPGRAHELNMSPMLLEQGARSARTFARCLRRQGAWFWKDPRLSLLMGYWDHVATHALELSAAFSGVVYVIRDPAAVATSLATRNNMDRQRAHDLWQLYNTSAATLCRGRPVYIVDYDELVARPDEQRSALVEWLESIGVNRLRRIGDRGAVDPTLRRSNSVEPSISDGQDLYSGLLELRGAHAVFPELDLSIDRSVSLRLESRRDFARRSWELNNRIDKRVMRTARRTALMLPAGVREVLDERRASP